MKLLDIQDNRQQFHLRLLDRTAAKHSAALRQRSKEMAERARKLNGLKGKELLLKDSK